MQTSTESRRYPVPRYVVEDDPIALVPAVSGATLRRYLIDNGLLVPTELVEARMPYWHPEPVTFRLDDPADASRGGRE